MLLKGIAEVDASNRPVQAAEMLLIRLAHAADLPTLDEALKSLENGASSSLQPPRSDGPRPGNGGGAAMSRAAPADAVAPVRGSVASGGGATMRLVEQSAQPAPVVPVQPAAEELPPAVPVTSIADIVALADKQRNMQFKILVKRKHSPCIKSQCFKRADTHDRTLQGKTKAARRGNADTHAGERSGTDADRDLADGTDRYCCMVQRLFNEGHQTLRMSLANILTRCGKHGPGFDIENSNGAKSGGRIKRKQFHGQSRKHSSIFLVLLILAYIEFLYIFQYFLNKIK
ncbi:hypothetical protein BLX87_00915 [Bacillus sp. VT-16-64]|nr:hypothetical protein BLX87_00915 [Bacillus sp. VT-16-64]